MSFRTSTSKLDVCGLVDAASSADATHGQSGRHSSSGPTPHSSHPRMSPEYTSASVSSFIGFPLVEVRTRSNRLPRHEITSPSVGKDSFKLTCPRCGWPCRHINPVYWPSEWNQYGGICGQCAQEAAVMFDATQWPDPE